MVCYVAMVMVLQGHHVSDKGIDWDAKGLQKISLLRRQRRSQRLKSLQTGSQQPKGRVFTWKMAYMMQLRGLLVENSATLKMLKLHLSISSSSWSGRTNMHTWAQQTQSCSRGDAEEAADLGELVLLLRVDAEARHGGAGEAGAVGQLPHPTDVAHGFIFQGGGRDLHLVLLVCTWEPVQSFLGPSGPR